MLTAELLRLKLDMVYRGLSREEAARRYDELVAKYSAAQAAQAAQAAAPAIASTTNPLATK